jgi:hypothetical protein
MQSKKIEPSSEAHKKILTFDEGSATTETISTSKRTPRLLRAKTLQKLSRSKSQFANHVLKHTELRKPFMSYPDDSYRIVWDLVVFIFVVIISIVIPLDISFEFKSLMSKEWSAFSYFMDAFFWCDIILNFRSAFVHGKQVVDDQRQIGKHYVLGWFPIDLVGNIPWEHLVKEDNVLNDKTTRKTIKIAKIMKFAKLLRLGRIIKYAKRYFKFRHIVTLSLVFVFVSHVSTCVWYLSEHQGDEADDKEKSVAYLSTLDAVVLQLLGISAFTESRRNTESELNVISLLISLLGTVITGTQHTPPHMSRCVSHVSRIAGFCHAHTHTHNTAMFYGTIYRVLTWSATAHDKFRSKLEIIQKEMEDLSLSEELKLKITHYYEYLWMHNLAVLYDGTSLCNDPDLNIALRREMSIEMVNVTFPFKKVSMLAMCSDDCLADLLVVMKLNVFMQLDVICHIGDSRKEMYFVNKGWAEALDANDKRIGTIKEGEFFGEMALLLVCCMCLLFVFISCRFALEPLSSPCTMNRLASHTARIAIGWPQYEPWW